MYLPDGTLNPLAAAMGVTGSPAGPEGWGPEDPEGKGDDHIVLGLRAFGLENTASQVGGRTLLNDPNWRNTLTTAINNPSTRFTVSLDGMAGKSTYNQVMSAAQMGIRPGANPTNWEMAQLYQANRPKDMIFMRGGQMVPNPF